MVKEVLPLTAGVLVAFREKNNDILDIKLIIFGGGKGLNLYMYKWNCEIVNLNGFVLVII